MNAHPYKDIETIALSIIKDKYLLELCSQKASITNHTQNILNSKLIITEQINDCFIPFFTRYAQKSPHAYSKFIGEAHSAWEGSNDTKERYHFDYFMENIKKLKMQYEYASYTPPFVSYITESIIPNSKNCKQTYRNYDYKYFNARSYSYIMQNSDCLPYFHKDKILSQKELTGFFNFFAETNSYPLKEQFISQYYIDYYFSTYLFAQTLNLLEIEPLQPSCTIHKSEYKRYKHCFLFLCTLLQGCSGIVTKANLFDYFKEIFFNTGIDKNKHTNFLAHFNGAYEKCILQCAAELVFYNDIVYPYVKNLYFKEYNSLLEKSFPNITDSEFDKQLTNYINININPTKYKEIMSPVIDFLVKLCSRIPDLEPSALNYISQKFYNYTPSSLDSFYIESKPSYFEFIKAITPRMETTFTAYKAFMDLDINT